VAATDVGENRSSLEENVHQAGHNEEGPIMEENVFSDGLNSGGPEDNVGINGGGVDGFGVEDNVGLNGGGVEVNGGLHGDEEVQTEYHDWVEVSEDSALEDNFGVEVGEQLFDDLDLNDELNSVPIRDFTSEEVANGKEVDKGKGKGN